MRFHIGKPPATTDFTPQADGWTPLREPSPMVLNLLATPVGVVAAILIARAWGPSNATVEGSSSEDGLLATVILPLIIFGIGLPALIAVHELIHAMGYPKFGFTSSTTIAVWPSKLLFFAMTTDALCRNRLLLVYMLPLLVLSILPLVMCRSFGIESGVLMLVSIVNGLAAGGDIFCFFLILLQVPRNAELRNQGWATWWRIAN